MSEAKWLCFYNLASAFWLGFPLWAEKSGKLQPPRSVCLRHHLCSVAKYSWHHGSHDAAHERNGAR